MKTVPTPVIAAALFVVTFIGTAVAYASQGSVPAPFYMLDASFAGAAIGTAMPLLTTSKDPPVAP